ncbi:hypothetical protein [Streptomyces phaeochromogenes]
MTSPLDDYNPDGATDDAALDALLFAADDAVLDTLDSATDLDEGCARIFAASVTPDQAPVPYFLHTPTGPPPSQPPSLVEIASRLPAHGPGGDPRSRTAGPVDASAQHGRADIDEASATRQRRR